MSPERALMLACATGSAARMHPNGLACQRTAVDAYLDLVRTLERGYPAVNARMMEIAPGSLERQQLLARQLRDSGAIRDRAVLRQGQRVLQAVLMRGPRAIVAIFAHYDTVSEALLTLENVLEVNRYGTNQHVGHPSAAAHPAAPAHLPAL